MADVNPKAYGVSYAESRVGYSLDRKIYLGMRISPQRMTLMDQAVSDPETLLQMSVDSYQRSK